KISPLLPGNACFFSDGFSCYLSALLEVYHTLKTFPRTGKPGRPKQPVKVRIPREGCPCFRLNPATDSGRRLPLIPRESCPCFRLNPATPPGVVEHQTTQPSPHRYRAPFSTREGGAEASTEGIAAPSPRSLTAHMGLWSE